MLSIQEMVNVAEDKLREVRHALNTENGIWHPEIANIYGTGEQQKEPLAPAKQAELRESIRKIRLSHLLEFLAKSPSGTGIAGAANLVPDKLHDVLIYAANETDKVREISAYVAERWDGGDLRVAVVDDDGYKAQEFSSGGSIPTETIGTMLPTLTPKAFGVPAVLATDLIEDGAWDLVQYHIEKAGQAMGEKATDLALTVLKTATDGWGTRNISATGDPDETKYTGGATSDILVAWNRVGDDGWVADTLVTTSESWAHSISQTTTAATMDAVAPVQLDKRFDVKLATLNLDVIFSNSDVLHDTADLPEAAFTACVNLIFSRGNAMLTGRKRWMQVENYSNPMADLGGAVITSRQDSVTLYDDAIYILTET